MLSYLFFPFLAKECGIAFTNPKKVFQPPGFPNGYVDNQVCYWYVRLQYGEPIEPSVPDYDKEGDQNDLATNDLYDNYDDTSEDVGRYVLFPLTWS